VTVQKMTFEINGGNFSSLEEFFEEVGRVLIPGEDWGKNLDALEDVLRGGFGTPDEGFVIRWRNSAISRERLGYPETIRQLEKRLERSHSFNHERVGADLERAKKRQGQTVFDWLVEVIENHGEGGDEPEDLIELILA